MRTFNVASTVDAPAAEAWALLVDTTRWPEWGPTISSVRSASRFIGRGSRGCVRTRMRVSLPFEIVDYVEGRSWSWRIAGVQATGHRVEPLSPNRCRIVFQVPLLAWPYALVCRQALRHLTQLLSAGGGGDLS